MSVATRKHTPIRLLFQAATALLIGTSCGLIGPTLPQGAAVTIIRGKDSAGAIIELEKRGDDFTAARVMDVVLGTGEAEIVSTTDGTVEFTIDFPGGATITYRGRQADAGELDELMLSGTWRQHSGGVFGEDFGTWEVSQPARGTY